MKKKTILGICMIVLIFSILFFKFQGPILLKPRGAITEVEPTFYWINGKEKCNLLVAREISFENPLINIFVEENSFKSDQLDFGEYYWKLVYEENNKTFETKPVKFTINSFVAFSISGNFIKNVGNVGSNLISPTGFVILERGQNKEIENEDYRLEQV